MPAKQVLIDEELWTATGSTRRHEWRVLCEDLGKHPELLPGRAAKSLVVSVDEKHVMLEISEIRETELGPATERVTMRGGRETLDPVLAEYLDVIRRLDDDGISSMRAEVLDMAKKVLHDDAGKRIAAIFPALSEDQEARRRFFSLFVALAVDTTRLSHAHRHR